MYRILTKSCLTASIFLGMQAAHADHLLQCPAANELSAYHVELSLPFAYSAQEKAVKFVSVAFDKNGKELADKGVILYPVPASFTDNPATKTQEILSQLTLETPTPVTYQLDENTYLPMCVYALPGKSHFTAFLFANDFEDNNVNDAGMKANASKKPKNRHEQAMQLIKNMGPTAS